MLMRTVFAIQLPVAQNFFGSKSPGSSADSTNELRFRRAISSTVRTNYCAAAVRSLRRESAIRFARHPAEKSCQRC